MIHRFISTALIVALASACASSQLRRMSNDEAGRLRYGEFCGAGHPSSLQDIAVEDSQPRIAAIRAARPVDDIDAVCQLHDLCFETFGHDIYPCDIAAGNAFMQVSNETRGQCQDISFEWAIVFLRLKPNRSPVEIGAVWTLLAAPLWALRTTTTPVLTADRLAQSAIRSRMAEGVAPTGSNCTARGGRDAITETFNRELAKAMALACDWLDPVPYNGAYPVWGTYEIYNGVPTNFSREANAFFRYLNRDPAAYSLDGRRWVQHNCDGEYRVFE